MSSSRPLYLRARYLGVVAAGGAVGVLARYLLTEALAPALGQPVVTMIINVLGCLLLGLLLEALARRGPDAGVRRTLRLLIGTGGLGGFTTYSTFALDGKGFLTSGHPGIMIIYALGTVLLGMLAAAIGIGIGIAVHRRQGGRA